MLWELYLKIEFVPRSKHTPLSYTKQLVHVVQGNNVALFRDPYKTRTGMVWVGRRISNVKVSGTWSNDGLRKLHFIGSKF